MPSFGSLVWRSAIIGKALEIARMVAGVPDWAQRLHERFRWGGWRDVWKCGCHLRVYSATPPGQANDILPSTTLILIPMTGLTAAPTTTFTSSLSPPVGTPPLVHLCLWRRVLKPSIWRPSSSLRRERWLLLIRATTTLHPLWGGAASVTIQSGMLRCWRTCS